MSGALALALNGQLLNEAQKDNAGFSLADRGPLLGDGLFETLPIWNNQIIWLEEHLNRLQKSLELLGMTVPQTDISATIEPLLPIATAHDGNAILRLTITRGQGGRGLLPPDSPTPTILASLSAYPKSMAFADVSLATSTICRNEGSPLSKLKSLGYLDNILATKEASAKGAEDALIFNNQGKACCTTIANVFAVDGDSILTPPREDGVLDGIMRQKLFEILPKQGFEIKEQSLNASDIKKADGLFLTNSLRIMRRVTQLDGQAFESSKSDVISKCQAILRIHLQQQFAVNF